MKPMRIAQIMLARAFGGAERSFVDLSAALAARGHSVLAIGDERGAAINMLRDKPGIECIGIRCYGSWDRLAERHMRRELERFQPRLAHAHLARAAHLGGRAARNLAITTVAKTHNLVNLKYYQHIDCLVPTTTAQLRYLIDGGVAAASLEQIPNFSAINPVDAITARAAAPPYRIKAIGRLVQKKGFDMLLEAIALLRKRGLDVVTELAGDGPQRKALRRQLRALGLEASVRMPGWVDDVGAFLRGADLFVLPSRDEPFGIVVLEAMASGVPVLATRTQGPAEIVNAACGFLTDASDPIELAAAIEAALGAPDRLARAAAALASFKSKYSEQAVVDQYLQLYARLTASE